MPEQKNPPMPSSAGPEKANPEKNTETLSSEKMKMLVRSLETRLSALEKENQHLRAELAAARYRLTRSQERDRASLAQALHGGPIQEFSSLLFELNMLQQMVQEEGSAEIIDSLKENLKGAIGSLRQFVNELRPAALSHFGLQSAIRSWLEQFQTNYPHVNLALYFDTEERMTGAETEFLLYRVFRAAVDNVAQHARAQHLMVRLRHDEESVWLEVEDDGAGFQVPDDWDGLFQQGQMGLATAREQVAALGGTLSISSAPDAGTRVHVTVPRQSAISGQ